MPPPALTDQFWDARHPPADPTHLCFRGSTVLVTGANTGVGYQAALKYAQLGASTLVLAVRTVEKGEAAKAKIMRHLKDPADCNIIVKPLDLSTFSAVWEFAHDINVNIPGLNVVLLCAGVMSPKFTVGAEGFENAFQINVLSTGLLAILLVSMLQKTAAAGRIPHISFVNSAATQDVLGEWIPEGQSLIERINDATRFDHISQYYLVKLAQRYFVEAFAAKCQRIDPNIIVNCSCPGMCRGTDLHRDYPWWARLLMVPWKLICGRNPEHGSRTLVSATGLGPESQGKLWANDTLLEYAGFMATSRSVRIGRDASEEIMEILRTKAGLNDE